MILCAMHIVLTLDLLAPFLFSAQMSMVSHKSVKLYIVTGDPIDFSKLAKKESMDNVERWIVSISHTVRMIDFHQQEYRMLHERHLNGRSPYFFRSDYAHIRKIVLWF